MKKTDIVVIGAGPGGYVAAIRAAQLGLKTAIVEKQWLGGICLNVGCIPSKALLRNARLAHTLRERGKEFGFSFDNLKLDYSAAVKRSRKVSARLTKGVETLMRKNIIKVYRGTAKLMSKDTVQITKEDGELIKVQGKNIVIATGASPFILPSVKVDGKQVLTYAEAILQECLPDSALIIGAGAIGVEFATIWNSYGVPVTIVEMLDRIVPNEDEEISEELQKALTKRGINIMTGSKVIGVEKLKTNLEVRVETGEETQGIDTDQVLMAASFVPNSQELGLEKVGINVDAQGFVEIDERMATNIPGVWAVGDVTGKLMLAHVGSAQGVICAENIAGVETVTLDYEMMPRVTYCQPEVASFGLTKSQAEERGFDVKEGRFVFRANGKALGLGESSGFAKIISDAKYGEILGAHMIGPEVSELLPELTLAQMNELTSTEIARNVHAHPTLSEVLMEAAEAVEGHAIHI